MAELEWNGAAQRQRVLDAMRGGANDALAVGTEFSQEIAPFVTGRYQGSIQARPAQIMGNIVRGEMGSYGVVYATAIEFEHTGTPGKSRDRFLRGNRLRGRRRATRRQRRRRQRRRVRIGPNTGRRTLTQGYQKAVEAFPEFVRQRLR